MKKIDWHFERKALATHYLKTVYQGAINRIALLDVRRTGKTSFLLKDLYPVALENGFVPVYINLWTESENPATLIVSSIEQTLRAYKDKSSNTLKDIANTQIKKVEVGNSLLGKVAMEFDAKRAVEASQSDLLAINSALAELVKHCGDKVLIIIDEIQHLATSDKFDATQRALRTALDTFSDVCVVYSGSSRSGIDAMFSDKDKAFFNSAFLIDFPRLDREFVARCQQILKQDFSLNYNINELNDCYNSFDQSPFWFIQLVNYLLVNQASLKDGLLFVEAAIIQDGGFERLKTRVKPLDKQVLHALLANNSQMYSEQTLKSFSKKVGKKVTPSSVQASIRKLKTMGVISQYSDRYYAELPGFIKYLG